MINSGFFISQHWRMNIVGLPGEIPLSMEGWLRFIESRPDLELMWWEGGPYPARTAALGDYDKKKEFHKFSLIRRGEGFKISVEFNEMRPNQPRLLLCLELAEALGAHLFRFSAKKPVTREWIELKYPEKKKAE